MKRNMFFNLQKTKKTMSIYPLIIETKNEASEAIEYSKLILKRYHSVINMLRIITVICIILSVLIISNHKSSCVTANLLNCIGIIDLFLLFSYITYYYKYNKRKEIIERLEKRKKFIITQYKKDKILLSSLASINYEIRKIELARDQTIFQNTLLISLLAIPTSIVIGIMIGEFLKDIKDMFPNTQEGLILLIVFIIGLFLVIKAYIKELHEIKFYTNRLEKLYERLFQLESKND